MWIQSGYELQPSARSLCAVLSRGCYILSSMLYPELKYFGIFEFKLNTQIFKPEMTL